MTHEGLKMEYANGPVSRSPDDASESRATRQADDDRAVCSIARPFDEDGLHVISENDGITTYCACERDRWLIEAARRQIEDPV